tara:strand:+ start:2564 stop:3217 length:654 start_codon:yes stop_codon:yes gene_type:complete
MIDIKQNMLWPTMLFEMQMPDYDSIKKDLVTYIKTCKVEEVPTSGIGPFEQMHKKFLDESYPTLFNNDDSEVLNNVKDFCMNLTLDIAKNVNSSHVDTSNWIIRASDSWYHITKDKGYHDCHTHSFSPWCGIFYVDKGDSDSDTRNGINRFYNTNNFNILGAGNEYYGDYFDVQIEDGKLIVFPGNLPHSALPYYGKKDRIVISFNTEIKDKSSVNE